MADSNQQKKRGGYQPEASGPPPTVPPPKPGSRSQHSISRIDLIRQRLAMQAESPSGVAWLNAYRLDVGYLIEQLEALQAEHTKLVESAFVETPLEPLADHQAAHREIVGLKEQLEAVERWCEGWDNSAQRWIGQDLRAAIAKAGSNPAKGSPENPITNADLPMTLEPGDHWCAVESSPASELDPLDVAHARGYREGVRNEQARQRK